MKVDTDPPVIESFHYFHYLMLWGTIRGKEMGKKMTWFTNHMQDVTGEEEEEFLEELKELV